MSKRVHFRTSVDISVPTGVCMTVLRIVSRLLIGRAARLTALLRSAPAERAKIVQQLVEQVILDDKRIIIKLRRRALLGQKPR